MAVAAGLLLFMTVLMLIMHTVQIYSQARDIREAAMVGRMYMEKLRAKQVNNQEETIDIMNRSYQVQLSVRPINDIYEIHEVEVVDGHGTPYTFKRLSKIYVP